MSTYIKGPVCGVANCPSRLWRIIDGRRTCRYGHVMEGDVEFNDEDEDVGSAGVVTRRLNLTTNATGNFQSSFSSSQLQGSQLQHKSKKIYGSEARLLLVKSLQFVLKRQCTWLIKVQKLPKEFDLLVKIVWMKVLQSLDDLAEVTEEDTFDPSEGPEHHVDFSQKQRNKKRLRLSLVSTLAILYMAAVHMGLPLYTCDLIKWASAGRLPYFKVNEKLPASWRAQLPNYYLGVLEGGNGPQEGQVYIHIAKLCDRISFSAFFNNIVMYESMVLKLTMNATLPPEFFLFTIRLIRATSKAKNFEISSEEKPQYWVEMNIASYFLLAVKWLLIYNEEDYSFKWIKILPQRQERTEVSQDTIDKRIQKLCSSMVTQDTFDWTDDQTAQYLDWVEKAFLPLQNEEEKLKIDQRIAKRKLHKLFPLEAETVTSGTDATHSSTFVEELQERYIFFQSNYDSSEDKQHSEDERLSAINVLVNYLLGEIAVEYAVSTTQLETALRHVSQRSLMQLRESEDLNPDR
ncbi:RRN7 (YJL025W) [Zygosaccharomyces parabailii]|nr:RRN7 (YJL025W) [Zygosaccharomyces parabailii]